MVPPPFYRSWWSTGCNKMVTVTYGTAGVSQFCRKLTAHCPFGFEPSEQGRDDPLGSLVVTGHRLLSS